MCTGLGSGTTPEALEIIRQPMLSALQGKGAGSEGRQESTVLFLVTAYFTQIWFLNDLEQCSLYSHLFKRSNIKSNEEDLLQEEGGALCCVGFKERFPGLSISRQ